VDPESVLVGVTVVVAVPVATTTEYSVVPDAKVGERAPAVVVRALSDETLLAAAAGGAKTTPLIGTNRVANRIATKRFDVLIRHEVLVSCKPNCERNPSSISDIIYYRPVSN
jgi:hypothetical protein